MTGNLTRWNRAGLERFRYVDGNAVTFLEDLRLAEIDAFELPGGLQQWQALLDAFPVGDNESVQARHQRWLAQYHDHRQDYAWELLRSLARSAHVLGEYTNTHANETFIGTHADQKELEKITSSSPEKSKPEKASKADWLSLAGALSGLK